MSDDPSSTVREARLREAYQELYPRVQAGVWYVAASLLRGDSAAWNPQAPDPGYGRVLSDLHFEFRGGDDPEVHPPEARTRREDQPRE